MEFQNISVIQGSVFPRELLKLKKKKKKTIRKILLTEFIFQTF